MTQKLLVLMVGLVLSSAASAQEYGLAIGIHNTSASVDSDTTTNVGSISGKLGFDAGLLVGFELVPNVRFRTGVMYDQRPFDFKMTNVGKYKVNFAYIDVPVNMQYNFNEMFGVYGGLIVGIKGSDSISAPSGYTTPDVDMKTLYPLINVGVNMIFDDLVGFDLYYERGIGEFATVPTTTTTSASFKDYSTIGMHFIYWM